jgi:drug/metabolite transporter (DMT)-like permease
MFESWYLTLAIYFVAASSYSLLQRKYAQSSQIPLKLIPALVFGVMVYPAGVITALCVGDIWIHWQWQSIALLLLACLTLGLFNVVPYRINKYIDTTQYLIISNIYTPVVVLIGAFLLHEAFSGTQFLGMGLLITGVVLVAARGLRKGTFSFDRHSAELALLSIFLGIGLGAEKACLSYMSPAAYMIIGWGMQAAATFFFARQDLHAIRHIDRTGLKELLQLGTARSGHVIGFFMSVALSRNVALMASVTSFRIPLVFIASIFILKERDHLARKFVGVGIATAGLLLL